MPQSAIFGPVFATILLTFLVWVWLYVKRIAFIRARNFTPAQMATPGVLAAESPPDVTNPSDNFKNLFEVPVLFYALALYLFVTNQVDGAYVAAAWVFAGFRALHSAMHCTLNIVIVRFYLYLVSTLAVWFIAARALLQHLSS